MSVDPATAAGPRFLPLHQLLTTLIDSGIDVTRPDVKEQIEASTVGSSVDLALILERPDSVVCKALTGNLAMKDWKSFIGTLREIFEALRKEKVAGDVASYIPILAEANPEWFAASVTTVDGQQFSIGDTDVTFSVQSCAKPIMYAVAVEDRSLAYVHRHGPGFEPSGLSFNEVSLNSEGRPHNPYINSGAIATGALIGPGLDAAAKFRHFMHRMSDIAGGSKIGFSHATYLCEQETAWRNNALVAYMQDAGVFPKEVIPSQALDFYLQCCSIEADTRIASNIAATFAAGGRCPLTGKQVLHPTTVKSATSLMLSCGMYDYSGTWMSTVGLPAKSGVAGLIYVVVPHVMGIAIFSPPLDSHGNSVRGVALCKRLLQRYRFGIFDQLVGTATATGTACGSAASSCAGTGGRGAFELTGTKILPARSHSTAAGGAGTAAAAGHGDGATGSAAGGKGRGPAVAGASSSGKARSHDSTPATAPATTSTSDDEEPGSMRASVASAGGKSALAASGPSGSKRSTPGAAPSTATGKGGSAAAFTATGGSAAGGGGSARPRRAVFTVSDMTTVATGKRSTLQKIDAWLRVFRALARLHRAFARLRLWCGLPVTAADLRILLHAAEGDASAPSELARPSERLRVAAFGTAAPPAASGDGSATAVVGSTGRPPIATGSSGLSISSRRRGSGIRSDATDAGTAEADASGEESPLPVTVMSGVAALERYKDFRASLAALSAPAATGSAATAVDTAHGAAGGATSSGSGGCESAFEVAFAAAVQQAAINGLSSSIGLARSDSIMSFPGTSTSVAASPQAPAAAVPDGPSSAWSLGATPFTPNTTARAVASLPKKRHTYDALLTPTSCAVPAAALRRLLELHGIHVSKENPAVLSQWDRMLEEASAASATDAQAGLKAQAVEGTSKEATVIAGASSSSVTASSSSIAAVLSPAQEATTLVSLAAFLRPSTRTNVILRALVGALVMADFRGFADDMCSIYEAVKRRVRPAAAASTAGGSSVSHVPGHGMGSAAAMGIDEDDRDVPTTAATASGRGAAGGYSVYKALPIEELNAADPDAFGVSVCTVDGQILHIGDTGIDFPLMGAIRPLLYALACKDVGVGEVERWVGVEPTAAAPDTFSLMHPSGTHGGSHGGGGHDEEVPPLPDDGHFHPEPTRKAHPRPFNPFLDSGALATSALVGRAHYPSDKRLFHDNGSRFSHLIHELQRWAGGRRVGFSNSVFLAQKQKRLKTMAISYFAKGMGVYPAASDPTEAAHVLFQAEAVQTNTEVLSVIAATLANVGVCPLTQERCLTPDVLKSTLSLMYNSGLCRYTGNWMFNVGIPSSSGVSGAQLVVIPGLAGIAFYSPILNEYDIPARVVRFCEMLVTRYRMNIFDTLVYASNSSITTTNGSAMAAAAAAAAADGGAAAGADATPSVRRAASREQDLLQYQLCSAAGAGDAARVRSLLEDGADPCVGDYDQRTALHVACCDGRIEVVTVLLEHGASAIARDRWDNTPLDDARRHGHTRVVALLEEVLAARGFTRATSTGSLCGMLPPAAGAGGRRNSSAASSTGGNTPMASAGYRSAGGLHRDRSGTGTAGLGVFGASAGGSSTPRIGAVAASPQLTSSLASFSVGGGTLRGPAGTPAATIPLVASHSAPVAYSSSAASPALGGAASPLAGAVSLASTSGGASTPRTSDPVPPVPRRPITTSGLMAAHALRSLSTAALVVDGGAGDGVGASALSLSTSAVPAPGAASASSSTPSGRGAAAAAATPSSRGRPAPTSSARGQPPLIATVAPGSAGRSRSRSISPLSTASASTGCPQDDANYKGLSF